MWWLTPRSLFKMFFLLSTCPSSHLLCYKSQVQTRTDTHTHSSSYHSLWKWDLKFNGFWGGNLRDQLETSGLKMVCVSGVHSYISLCLLLAKVFGVPVEPCYQILKMLSCPPRLSTTAGDMSPSPLAFLHKLSESLSDTIFSCLVFLLLIPSVTRSV